MDSLDKFDPRTAGAYNAGQIIILFDGRHCGPKPGEDKTTMLQSYWMKAMCSLGWPSVHAQDLEPGRVRLMWYTHAGNEGTRDFPLWKAYGVKDMFDELSDQGFRPLIIGWSAENPFPMIGGSEPPPEPKKKAPRVAKTYSMSVAGHSTRTGETPHDRVMAIIDAEEEREAKKRKEDIERAEKANDLAV
ncbi:Hypothetical protein R9X50_00224200 [Acrodontium crateriforme]|uniref:Uncharacterized protein n=1 Tax=Acrodontium crateriforme TaxID=150365 RepID=A0AAQ3R6H1_9PEZI|nr:Hypothetical protein R9X50_00224200 [Acrodontium crateriforme]